MVYLHDNLRDFLLNPEGKSANEQNKKNIKDMLSDPSFIFGEPSKRRIDLEKIKENHKKQEAIVREMANSYGKVENFPAFMQAYGMNSTFTINGLLRHQSKESIEKGKFTKGVALAIYDDYLWGICEYINNCGKTYFPITKKYVQTLVDMSFHFLLTPALKTSTVLYRGCNDLDVDGVSGLVSTTESMEFASLFDRGTLLKIHVPAGMKVLTESSIPLEYGQEHILPPCSYTILKDEIIDTNNPNNPSHKTRFVEIAVTPKELMQEIAMAIENPPEDYFADYPTEADRKAYEEALSALVNFEKCELINEAIGNKPFNSTLLSRNPDMFRVERASQQETEMTKAIQHLKSQHSVPVEMKESVAHMAQDIQQVGMEEFLDYIKNSKHFHVLNEYLHSTDHHRFYENLDDGFHGIKHVDNSTLFAYYLASKYNFSETGTRLIMEATRFHDCGREGCAEGESHGTKGAEIYNNLNKENMSLFERQLVGLLIDAHDKPAYVMPGILYENIPCISSPRMKKIKEGSYLMMKIVRDADVLDHVNVGLRGNPFTKDMLALSETRKLIGISKVLNTKTAENTKQNETATKTTNK